MGDTYCLCSPGNSSIVDLMIQTMVKISDAKPLTKRERTRFLQLDKEIDKKIEEIDRNLLELGRMLEEVRDGGLWRGKYNSYGDYIQSKLKRGRQYGYRILDAWRVANSLLEEGAVRSELPNTERIYRELAQVKDPGMRKMIYDLACKTAEMENKPLERKHIQEAIAQKGLDASPADAAESKGDAQPEKVLARQVRQIMDDMDAVSRKVTVNIDFHRFETHDLKSYRNRAETVLYRVSQLLQQTKRELENRGELEDRKSKDKE
jgi:hypothetical protein